MTSYRIGLTKARDFLPFKELEFDFSQPGLTVVEGEIVGQQGCDSNGSGKSALIEAPVWAITGRCIRERYKGDDVIRLGSKLGARVEVNLIGPKDIRIVRYRKDKKNASKVFLFVDGEDVSLGTSQQTDKRIEAELGLDFTTFMNTVAFGARAEVRSFFFAADAERKRIMDILLGLGVFAAAQTLAKQKARALADEKDALMTKQLNEGFEKGALEDSLRKVQDAVGVDPIELGDARILARRLQVELESQQAVLDQAEKDLDAEDAAHRAEVRTYERAMDAHNDAVERYRKVSVRHERDAAGHTRDAQRANETADRLRGFKKDGSPCPTCLQPIDKKAAAGIIQDLEAEASAAEAKAAEAEKEAQAALASIDELVEPEEPSNWAVSTVHEEVGIERAKRDDLKARVAAAKKHLTSLEDLAKRATTEVDTIQAKIDALTDSLDKNLRKQGVIGDKLDRIQFWVDGFSNAGLKSFVIEAELPEINRIATSYAQRLLGAGAYVRLQATRQLKSKDEQREEMVVEAAIPGCTESYAGASKGQRHRLDLALILAFRDVVSARSASPFDQLFADELFDGVDPTGVDCVVELATEVAESCPVLLVTHDPRLKSVGDRLVTVRHENGYAVLKE